MSDSYTKLFRGITTSTIVGEPLATRWLWVTMLASCDRKGVVYGSVPGLARLANITVDECVDGLKRLMSPDEWSRTKDHDGRRVAEIDGGWLILNHAKYDAMRSADEAAARKREWDRENRPSGHARSKAAQSDQSDASPMQSDDSPQQSAKVRCPLTPALTPTLEEKAVEQSASAPADAPLRADPIPYQAIVDAYNTTMTKLAKVRELTTKRKTAIRRAWQESKTRQSLGFWRAYFEECADDPWLRGDGPYGNGHENWRPTFDFLIRPDQVTKVYESAMNRLERAA